MRLDLHDAVFLRRYKRFLADCRLPDGRVITAHCPNSGSMRTLLTPDMPARLRFSNDPRRKLAWTLVLLGLPGPTGRWALVDTMLPNRIVQEGITRGRIPELAGYASLRCEVAYGSERSRIDLLLEDDHRPPCYIEVKNNTMASSLVAGRSDFPDARTERGAKHLRELTALARDGIRAVQFYLVDRSDCRSSGIAEAIDPAYAATLREAIAAGVEVLCYRADLRRNGVSVGRRCPFDFS